MLVLFKTYLDMIALRRGPDAIPRSWLVLFVSVAMLAGAWSFQVMLIQGLDSSRLWFAFAGIVFCNSAGEVVTRAFAGELFPTSQRGASTGWIAFSSTLGWSIGLFMVGIGTTVDEDLAATVGLLAWVVALGGVCLLALPETRRRRLEEISGEA